MMYISIINLLVAYIEETEILEIDDDDERFDLIRECTNCKNLSKEQMDEIIDYEEYLIELHYNASIVRPIEQNYTNNMINVTIQLLGVIPGLPELLKAKESIYNEDYIVRALSKCIDLYLDNSYEGIARMLPSEIVENIDMDIVEIIEHLFRVADLKYGLHIHNTKEYISVINMFEENNSISIHESINALIQNQEYEFNKVIFFYINHKKF